MRSVRRARAAVWPFLVTLADGRVLVGGGRRRGSAGNRRSCSIRETGTFSRTGSMDRPRISGVSATLFPRRPGPRSWGRPRGRVPTAELYDPVTGTFALHRSDYSARAQGSSRRRCCRTGASWSPEGYLYPGRSAGDADRTATAEVYDPATGTFSAVGPMAAPRYMHAAAILPDGTVLIAGGAHELPPSGLPAVAWMRRSSIRPRAPSGRRAASFGQGSRRPPSQSISGCSCSAAWTYSGTTWTRPPPPSGSSDRPKTFRLSPPHRGGFDS